MRPPPSRTKRSLKAPIDSTAGYKLNRTTEPEAIVAMGASSFPALMKAFMALPRREDDHLRARAIIVRLSEPGSWNGQEPS
jgi:hypothetical protein